MKEMQSSLYSGHVMHLRHRPRRHLLRYGIYSLLLDLDELPSLDNSLRLFSINRFNLFCFHEADHGAGTPNGLREWVREQLHDAGLDADGTILLLTMPRILGYVFNPLSVYFCHDRQGRLRAILYEVNSTFGERHSYLLEVAPDQQDGARVRQHCGKVLHVSPFISLDMDYHFHVQAPQPGRDALSLAIGVHDSDGRLLATRLRATRNRLDDATLLRLFVSHPLLTLKVIAGIHWEALKLWLKGTPIHTRPAPASASITILKSGSRYT